MISLLLSSQISSVSTLFTNIQPHGFEHGKAFAVCGRDCYLTSNFLSPHSSSVTKNSQFLMATWCPRIETRCRYR